MPQYKMIFLTEPVDAASEEKYNIWYQNTHLPDVTNIDGVSNGQRYKLALPMSGENVWQYMVLYDVNTNDPTTIAAAIGAGLENGSIFITDALGARVFGGIYEVFGSPVG